jgi:hypothetical protein
MPVDNDGVDFKKWKQNCTVLIETGTAFGDGISSALCAGIEKIYSIELQPDLHRNAVDKFKDNKNVEIIYGNSMDVLPSLIEKTKNESVLFWLDAHWSGSEFAGEMMNVFLPKELDSIEKHISVRNNRNIVIMIDDMNFYEHDTAFKNTIEEKLKKIIPECNLSYYKSSGNNHIILVAYK